MKNAYPIILTPSSNGYVVFVPDFNINTQGSNVPDAMYMARDAIELIAKDMIDDGEPLPIPTSVVPTLNHGEFVEYVEILL